MSIKAWLPANHDYVQGGIEGVGADPYAIISEAVHSITPEDTSGWYQHGKYIAWITTVDVPLFFFNKYTTVFCNKSLIVSKLL